MYTTIPSSLFKKFAVLMIASFFSMCSYALSPALLDQLKKDNIVDTTNTLSMNEIDHLKGQNQSLYKEKNIDFKILMIPSIGEISIEEYALDVFNTLKIGNKELDNGLLLVIAKDDRKMRFEVGYGLEGDITDVQAGRLIRNDLAPAFKQGEYFQGLSAIVPHLLDIETSSYNLKNSPPSEQIISNNNQNQFIVFLGVMLIYGFISLLTALTLLLIVYLVKRYKKPVQPEPPEIVIGTDGKQYIRIKKNRPSPLPDSIAKGRIPTSSYSQNNHSSSSSSSNSMSSSSSSSNSSSSNRDSGGSSGGGGASGGW